MPLENSFTLDSLKVRQGKHGSSAPILPSAISIILIYPNNGSCVAIIRVAEVELLGHKVLISVGKLLSDD